MKTLNKNMSPKTMATAAIAISLPLLMLGGCAGHETVKMTSDASIENSELTEQLEVVDGSQMETGIVVDFIPELEVIEIAGPVNVQGESEEVQEEVPVDVLAQKTKTPKPNESLIGFAFDEANISVEYGEMLWQHAQYLQENKNLILTVSGHTDNSGARVYNEMLSLKRAQQVANILIDFGVPKERIKVIGNASDQPLVGAINKREHRRVELDFQDTQLVSN